MQGIMDYLHSHPEEGKAIMNENKSFIFFREITGPGPIGAMGLPVTGEVSVAADPKFIPMGAPIFLRSEEHTSELQSLMRQSYAVFCLKKNTYSTNTANDHFSTQTTYCHYVTSNK